MDATTLSANFDAREKATNELRTLVDEFAGKDMDDEARGKETALLAAVADFDGRVKRGIDAIKASESVDSLMAGLKGTGEKRSQGKLAEAAEKLRGLRLEEGIEFRAEAGDVESRAIDKGTQPNMLDRTLYGQLLAEAVERSTVMRNGASIVTTSGGEPIDFTVVTGRASAGIVGENGLIPESNPTSVQRSVGAYKYAYASIVSSEFIADKALDLVGFLVGDAGPAIGEGMGQHFLTGTGTGQPKGILVAAPAATAAYDANDAGAVVSDAFIDLFYELPSSYRQNAVYAVSDLTAAKMRKLKATDGTYLWQTSLVAGAPDMFNGKPVVTDSGIPDDKVLFADLSKYRVRMAGALRVERSVDFKFLNDQVVYRFIQRADGLLVDERAAKVLTVGPAA